MPVSNRYILHQAPVIAGLAHTAVSALVRQVTGTRPPKRSYPSPWVDKVLAPRPADLVRDYIRNVGGDPSAYKGRIPPHMFPQWGFPFATRELAHVDYPLQKVLNAGCRLEIRGPLPVGRPLRVRARIEEIDDNGRRALIHQHVLTGTDEQPDAVSGHMFVVVPLGGGDGAKKDQKKKEPARVPANAREIAFWRIGPKAGLDFAKLTGDFNPVHWLPPYARAFGFKGCILHGFATTARAMEGVNRNLLAGDTSRIRLLDVSFTSPLLLPARVGLYLAADDGIYVGDAPGGRAYLTGRFELGA